MTEISNVIFPKRSRGRQSEKAQAKYDEQVNAFCNAMTQIASTVDFAPSSRGWCYMLEGYRIIDKGDFDAAQRLINDLRKSGRLPIDICDDDGKREFVNLEKLNNGNADWWAEFQVSYVRNAYRAYTPISFWGDKDVYLQCVVEKSDLKSLFEPVCAEFYVPLANQGGWADLWTRYRLAERFKKHEGAGRQCVLLYCGDHDPGGLAISEFIRSNLADMAEATDWTPDNLIIDRFGLNYDFIEANGLTWIDNLETSSGKRLDSPKHPDHDKPYVQSYLKEYGARKVEANALVVRPTEGRQLCRDAIVKWLGDEDAPGKYDDALKPYREEVRKKIVDKLNGGLA